MKIPQHRVDPISAMIITWIVFVGAIIILFLSTGCSSTPCVPTHEIVEVMVPVSSCPEPPVIPPTPLPPWPTLPDDATADEIKTWYVDMVEAMKAREAIAAEENSNLRSILESYGSPTE